MLYAINSLFTILLLCDDVFLRCETYNDTQQERIIMTMVRKTTH